MMEYRTICPQIGEILTPTDEEVVAMFTLSVPNGKPRKLRIGKRKPKKEGKCQFSSRKPEDRTIVSGPDKRIEAINRLQRLYAENGEYECDYNETELAYRLAKRLTK